MRKGKKMNNLLIYLLSVSFGTTLLYLCYLLLFRKDTFYNRNRILLILILLLPMVFPAIKIPVVSVIESPEGQTILANNPIPAETPIIPTIPAEVESFNYNRLIALIYFTITALLILRVIISLIRTYMIIRKGEVKCGQFPKVIVSELTIPPFSFFPYAVIPAEDYKRGNYNDLINHEFAHIRQGHTFDLLLCELFIAFQWFNPVIWLIKRSVLLNHEYLADRVTIRNNKSAKEYQYRLLNFRSGLKTLKLAHSFNSLIKNRIVMINKKPTRNYATLKSLIILPVVAILFVMFSFKPENTLTKTGNQKPLFSKTSESEILVFLANNTGYPQEARNSSDTGKVFIVVKMNKGGFIKECKAFSDKKAVNVPLLPEIVIVGYKPSGGTSAGKSTIATSNEHPTLKTECLRVTNTLSIVKIPEWKDKDMEFAIAFKFMLK